MSRTMSKTTIAAILFAVLVLAVIIYQTLSLRQYECEVCMEFEGQKKCLTVKGESEQQAMQTAKDNACSFLTHSRAESFRCSQTAPASVQCKRL